MMRSHSLPLYSNGVSRSVLLAETVDRVIWIAAWRPRPDSKPVMKTEAQRTIATNELKGKGRLLLYHSRLQL